MSNKYDENVERIALVALREALKNLTMADVRFNIGRTGANWFKIRDVALYSNNIADPGSIVVLLEPASNTSFVARDIATSAREIARVTEFEECVRELSRIVATGESDIRAIGPVLQRMSDI